MKNSTKLTSAITAMLAIIVFIILATYTVSSEQKDAAVVINLAGRQRMLSQKTTKEFLFMISENREEGGEEFKRNAKLLLHTMRVFRKTLFALKDGGDAPMDHTDIKGKHRNIRGSEGETEMQLKRVVDLWIPFEDVIKRATLGESGEKTRVFVKSQNLKVLKEMNRAVFMMQEEAEEKVTWLKTVLMVGFLISVLIFIVSIYVILNVIKRIQLFTTTMKNISKGSGELTVRIDFSGKDEFFDLAHYFNIFVEQSQKMQNEIVESSHQAGMAMVATSTLHNIGNILNSVNVSLDLLREDIKNAKPEDLKLVTNLLEENLDSIATYLTLDERGQNLIPYINELGSELEETKNTGLGELGSINKNIEHIKQVISWQQSYARVKKDIVEEISPEELIEEAFNVGATSFKKYSINVIKDFERTGNIKAVRHKIIQILINLVNNAKQAVVEAGKIRGDGEIRMVIKDSENETIQFKIIDNGIGIDEKNRSRIFQFGFTTKKDGHGFGLHSCSLLAKELGGNLKFDSEGAGKGARFVLTIPFEKSE